VAGSSNGFLCAPEWAPQNFVPAIFMPFRYLQVRTSLYLAWAVDPDIVHERLHLAKPRGEHALDHDAQDRVAVERPHKVVAELEGCR